MDQKQIGLFLRTLRKQKGLTQGQLAEYLNVSDRSVSRWENGNNLPDLSILVELADYYAVDIGEIIEGERKGNSMDTELKATLQKVADYGDCQKQHSLKAGGIAFSIAFFVCAITIVVQLIVTGKWSMVIGETITFLTAGIIYLFLIVKNGAFDSKKHADRRYTAISVICAGSFSIIMALCLLGRVSTIQVLTCSSIFFAAMAIIGRIVLGILNKANRNVQNKG